MRRQKRAEEVKRKRSCMSREVKKVKKIIIFTAF